MSNHHKINYLEFRGENLEKIKAFYSAAFGWKFTDYGPNYIAFNDGSLDGGFSRDEQRVKKSACAPLVILYSNNLDETIAIIKKHGGTIKVPTYSFPGGRRFHFTDPDGNELAVWSDK